MSALPVVEDERVFEVPHLVERLGLDVQRPGAVRLLLQHRVHVLDGPLVLLHAGEAAAAEEAALQVVREDLV